ncbi:hypothetical protein [Tsukamurella sp. TY48]|uniref:hypothetical protein n=1 Tax=Tsukamurella TaxID=2060 RepID=UPI001C7DBE29|nr:hypothetical protein [Tsukamurella sp. TY48]
MMVGTAIGVIAGMWWVLGPGREGVSAPVWGVCVAVVALLGAASLVLARRSAPRASAAPSGRGFVRNPRYWAAVAVEVILVVVGNRVAVASGRRDLSLSIVLIAVGVHFLPLMWALFGRWSAAFGALGFVLTACGVGVAAARIGGAPEWVFGVVGGIVPALAFTAIPLVVMGFGRSRRVMVETSDEPVAR